MSMHLEVEVSMLMIALSRYVWMLIRHPYILTDLQSVIGHVWPIALSPMIRVRYVLK